MICCCRYTFQRTSVLRLTFQNSMIWIGNQSLWYSLQANKKTHKIFISVIYVQYKFHSNNEKLQLIFITSSFLSFHSVWNPHKQTNRSIALHILLIQSQLCRYDTDTHITFFYAWKLPIERFLCLFSLFQTNSNKVVNNILSSYKNKYENFLEQKLFFSSNSICSLIFFLTFVVK